MKERHKPYPRVDFESLSTYDRRVLELARQAVLIYQQHTNARDVTYVFQREDIGWLHNPDLPRETAAAVGLAVLSQTARLLGNNCSPDPSEFLWQITPSDSLD